MIVSQDALLHYNIHGVPLRVACSTSAANAAFCSLLGAFACAAELGGPTIHLQVDATEDTDALGDLLPLHGSILYSNRPRGDGAHGEVGIDFDLYQTDEETLVDLGDRGCITFQRDAGRATIVLSDHVHLHDDIIASLVLYTVSELLKPHGLRMLHAAAVAKDGRAVIIPGTQGRGKTTACLALCLSGFSFMSDDIVFVRERDGRTDVCALPEHLSLTDDTIAMFPELKSAADQFSAGLLKQHVMPGEIFDGSTEFIATPGIVLFPEVTGEDESRLEPLPRARALEMLLPRGLSVLDQSGATESFHALSKLVAQSECYRLKFGRRVQSLAPLVDRALANGS